jgi:hypothetical protein
VTQAQAKQQQHAAFAKNEADDISINWEMCT